MIDILRILKPVRARVETWLTHGLKLGRPRRLRKIGLGIVGILIFYGLAGFVGGPMLLRHIASQQLAKMLARPVSVGKIRFNPFTLKFTVDRFHIGERESQQSFVDIGHLQVKISWASLVRLAPVIRGFKVDRPAIHIVRTGDDRFNFSDLTADTSATPIAPAPSQPPAKPLRFAISNIELTNGEVRFDDAVLNQRHALERIFVGIPFIANLPSDVNIFVQPLLQMEVDGRRLRLSGKSRPFADPPESIIDINLHQLELPLYFPYLARTLPLKLLHGALSCAVEAHFVAAADHPFIRLTGTVALDQVDLRDRAAATLFTLNHAVADMNDVEPLRAILHLGKIHLDGLKANLALNPDGTTNLTPLTDARTTQATPPVVAPAPSATASAASQPADVSVDLFELLDGAVKLTDRRSAQPAVLALDGVHAGLKAFRTTGQIPASFKLGANLIGGGSIAIAGALDVARSKVKADLTLEQIDLPALQSLAQPVMAGTLQSGKFGAHASVRATFAKSKFNLHAEPADFSLDQVQIRAADGSETPVQWTGFSASIAQIDLRTRQAAVNEFDLGGLRLNVRRRRNGKLNLASLLRVPTAAPSQHPAAASKQSVAATSREHAAGPKSGNGALKEQNPVAPAPPWKYRIGAVAVEKTEINFEDDTLSQPVKLAIAPLNLHLKSLSSDLAKPFDLALDGTLNRHGSFKIAGATALKPLKADLHVDTKRLDLAAANPYVGSRLNTVITSAALTMNGALGVALQRNGVSLRYRGDAALGNVRMMDKLTGHRFVRWSDLDASRIDASLGGNPPNVHIGALSLANFYARIILNSDARLNLSDILTSPASAPTSLTEPGAQSHEQPSPSEALHPSSSEITTKPVGAAVEIGHITLADGNINYTDNFIQPHYTANLTDISGNIGALGTSTATPADVIIRGDVNGSAPVAINGSIDPFAPSSFLDLRAKASGIELPNLTPYSTKYTGYPIVKGTLTVDVRYLLAQQKLTAENHILLDQLTFGDRIASRDATNLPVRLAVALLKNSRGQIDVDLPISGSLSDPQFSAGGAILYAVKNLIARATTAPFRLLAAAVSGLSGGAELSHIDFAPGVATLTQESQKKLATLAQALQNRPALRLDISGRADPALDLEGLRQAKLDRQVRSAKVNYLRKEGESVPAGGVTISPDEYNDYLKSVYKAAKFPKPENFLGMNKSLPPEEMKKLLLAHIEVNDQDLRALAEARANAVRKWLATRTDAARLFLMAPKLNAVGIKTNGPTTRVDLALE